MVKVDKTTIDTTHDGKIDEQEWNKWYEANKAKVDSEGVEIDGTKYTAKDFATLMKQNPGLFAQAASANDPAGNDAKKVDQLNSEVQKALKELNDAQASGKPETEIQKLKEALQAKIKALEAANQNVKKSLNLGDAYKAAGMQEPSGQQLMSGKAQASMSTGGSPQASGATPYSGQIPAAGGGTAGFSAPSGWAAQTLGSGMPTFSSDAYMKTMAMEGDIQSSWDSINKNTNRGKQLMMLFFYFARMAESGDMTAMYQFMKFITYVISKDKAKQQIEMGKKLIQLQELSRQWTNKLLNVQTNSNDPAASNELMKTMTIVKSETDAIATSQKLISQMMEEFAQVVETLTNTTKAALETAGRISRTVSTMR